MFLPSHSQSSSVDSNVGNDNQTNTRNMVISYGKEILCIFAFLLTTFASVQNSTPKVSRAAPPVPFFSKGSNIEEFFGGQLTPTLNKVSLSDLTFVLYYSPWASEFEHSRAAFEQVAQIFNREASFAAINCWQPGSECRNQYMKISSWPIMMAYQRNGFGTQYQKNIWTEEALTRFISSLLKPIERVNSPEELLALMSRFEALVVGFFGFPNTDSYQHYRSFYRSSLKYLEKDNFKEVGFAVVTGETTALAFGVDYTPSIRAYMWNETLQYYGNHSWSSKSIVSWITENFHQVSINLSPPGTKSFSLSPFLTKGPLLILFTPRNYYWDSDIYIMLKQIGMEYYNCEGDNWVQEMARDYLFERRMENREDYETLRKECALVFIHNDKFNSAKSRCSPVSVSDSNVLNTSKIGMPDQVCEVPEKTGNCGYYYKKKAGLSYQKSSTKQEKLLRTSMIDDRVSDVSPDAILKYNFHKKCEMLKLAEKKRKILFIDEYEDITDLRLVSGLACKANKTISFISLDSSIYHTFSEKLGVNILELENQTSAMIVDHENESTFLLDQPVNLIEISKFLYKYHQGSLTRFLRSNSVEVTHTHFFDFKESTKIKLQQNISVFAQKKCQTFSSEEKPESVVIQEINSEEFETAVIKSNKTSVVFFFSANCAFCSIMQHSVLFMARIFENMPDMEVFRIDGDKNDLPWQYSAFEYPALVVFPAAKSESRKYPSEMSINNTNIIGFVLANLSRRHRLLGLVMSCQNGNYKRHNTNDCIKTIQGEITESISFFLRAWRKYPRKRSVIIKLFRQLREIYLNLFLVKSSCDFAEIQTTVVSLLDRWLVATTL